MNNKEAVYKQQLLAGIGTGLIMTAANPFDLLRNRLQTMG